VQHGYPTIPLYVIGQSIPPGTPFDPALVVKVQITVIGYPTVLQPNTIPAVP
jgi:hypothetical protein